MKTTLDKLQEIQRRAFYTTNNVSFSIAASSTLNKHWCVHIHMWHCSDIAFTVNLNSYDDSIEHRLDMILKHGLFGRLKA